MMKFLSKFITNKRILSLINSNRFRGLVIAFLTWLTTKIAPGYFDEGSIGQIASYVIYSVAGITTTVGGIEAQDRKYSTKKRKWEEPA